MSQPPFTLVGFDHVVFYVDEMDRALRFYREVLGCVPGYSYPAMGMEQLWCGGQLIVLWDTTHEGSAHARPAVPGRNVDHLCIATSPFESYTLRDHLAAHGVEILREATHGGARGMGFSARPLRPHVGDQGAGGVSGRAVDGRPGHGTSPVPRNRRDCAKPDLPPGRAFIETPAAHAASFL